MECSKSGSKREVHSKTGPPQEARKSPQINNLTYHLKELEKEEQSQQKEGDNKDQRGNK